MPDRRHYTRLGLPPVDNLEPMLAAVLDRPVTCECGSRLWPGALVDNGDGIRCAACCRRAGYKLVEHPPRGVSREAIRPR